MQIQNTINVEDLKNHLRHHFSELMYSWLESVGVQAGQDQSGLQTALKNCGDSEEAFLLVLSHGGFSRAKKEANKVPAQEKK